MPRWPIKSNEEREARRKEVKRAKDARHYAKHKGRLRARHRKYYEDNREALLRQFGEYRAANRDARNAVSLAWKNANRDRVRAVNRKWKEDNRDHWRALMQRRRAVRAGAGGSHTKADLSRIRRAQKGCCAYCRVKLASVIEHTDHIVPLSKGGSNAASNIQLLCAPCNLAKGAKDATVFAQAKGLLL